MLHTEFERDGARWVGDEVELPACVWADRVRGHRAKVFEEGDVILEPSRTETV
jgi:hypothetical protein